MARVKRGVTARKRHKKVLELASGFTGTHNRLFRPANEAVMHSLAYQYRDRRKRKGNFRRLWIARINAASRQAGIPYSRFIAGLGRSGVELSRKQISELAIRDPEAFARLVEVVRETAPDQ
ncbi:MAG TPA: 50S ribosomal protein L20 [Candidatus Dormibacteraeota bacterium]|nr:50S ribosomal protein L20 [Candidatus Dormibacteraeota bacterium]